MRCDNCGSEVDDKDIYCGNCGHRIERDYEVVNNHVDDDFIDVTPEEPFGSQNNNSAASANGRTAQNGSEQFRNNGQYNNGQYNNGYNYNNPNANNIPPRYKPKLSNSSAIISMVCGILSLLGFFTLITAIVGLNMAKKAKQLIATGEYDGDGFAKAGQICSTIGLVFGILQLVMILFMGVLPVITALVTRAGA